MYETSYILLGEGDYTYSLDACRYLSSMDDDTKEDDSEKNNNNVVHHHHRITCTGIDTLHELQTKYHDVNFVLNKLYFYSGSNSRNSSSNSNNVVVTTNIIHGVNAVSIDECNNINNTNSSNNTTTNSSNNSNKYSSSSSGYDHVIFNHPHIGTENATLHSQFLAHLFHACNKTWMKKSTTTSSSSSRSSSSSSGSSSGALLHITLVIGQCERWNCIMYATKHELILLRRGKFITPPPPPRAGTGAVNDYSCNSTSKRKNSNDNNKNTYYNLRRHQSGRSFANRRSSSVVNNGNNRGGGGGGDSETLVFGRVCDYQHLSDDDDDNNNKYNTSQFLLPWECNASSKNLERKSDKHNNSNNNINTDKYSTLLFTCKHCNNKSFREYRSLRNHLLSLHPTCSEAMHSLLDTTNETKKKKKKKKMNYLNDKKRKLLTISDNKYDEDNGKCQEMMQQQQHESLHHCSDTILNCPTIIYTCSLCDDTGRIFPNKDALLSHQRAKHFGNHKDIKPDWYRREDDHDIRNNDKEAGDDFAKSQVNCEMQCCQICDRQYVTGMDDVIHALEFLPSSSAIAKAIMMERSKNVNNVNNNNDISVEIHPTSPVYRCIFCSKSFTQIRAQHQHENFCSSRQQQQSEQSTNT